MRRWRWSWTDGWNGVLVILVSFLVLVYLSSCVSCSYAVGFYLIRVYVLFLFVVCSVTVLLVLMIIGPFWISICYLCHTTITTTQPTPFILFMLLTPRIDLTYGSYITTFTFASTVSALCWCRPPSVSLARRLGLCLYYPNRSPEQFHVRILDRANVVGHSLLTDID